MLNDQRVSDFSFLGNRNYIQAHTLLEFVIKSLKDYYDIKDNIQISYFNVHHESVFNVFLTHEKRVDVPAIAVLKYFLNGDWNIIYIYPTNIKIGKRVKDVIEPVNIVSCDGSFSGVGTIEHVCSFWDVLAGIVEINKQLHFVSLDRPEKDPGIRAVYFKKLKITISNLASRSIQKILYFRFEHLENIYYSNGTLILDIPLK